MRRNRTDWRRIWVTLGGIGTRRGHVWQSDDGGATFRDISGVREHSRLPDLSFHSIVQSRWKEEELFVATDLGIFRTTDGGDWWYPWDEGLPNAQLTDMDYSAATDALYSVRPSAAVSGAAHFPEGPRRRALRDNRGHESSRILGLR